MTTTGMHALRVEGDIVVKPLVERLSDRAQRELKKLTSARRALPDFVIIGTQKGGTSSLHGYLSQHPRLFPADVKEVNFFDGGHLPHWDKYAEGERLYRSYFPYATTVRTTNGLGFEASPEYLHSPLAAQRMARMIPQAKLIVLLRDPVERAISSYFHEVRRGRETRPILQALQTEDAAMDDVRARGNYKDLRWIWKAYITRGLYAQQLERFFAHYPREQILILESSDFYSETERTLAQVLEFVGMDDAGFEIDLTPVGVGTNRTKVGAEVYDWLTRRFDEPNAQLESLLERRFDWVAS